MTLRVLVIDDSAYNRKTLTEMLESLPDVMVVGRAFDGEEGLKLATQLMPDLITLDIEMPRMDGFTFLRILMAQLPTPVIVVSSHSRKEEVFQALELGALDFIAKPSHHIGPDLESVRGDLAVKVAAARALRALPRLGTGAVVPVAPAARVAAAPIKPAGRVAVAMEPVDRVVVLGASTGGPPALETVLKALPTPVSTAVLVGQHMPEKFTRAFAERLNRMVGLEVAEAENGMVMESGHVYVAPGGRHLVVASKGGRPELRLVGVTSSDHYTPSIDRLMTSAAEVFGFATLGVVMTGMGSDGSRGVEAVRAAGGATLAEAEESAVVYGMPKEAVDTGCVDAELPLSEIIDRIVAFTRPASKGA